MIFVQHFYICVDKEAGSNRKCWPNRVFLTQRTNDGEFQWFGPISLWTLNLLSNYFANLSFDVSLKVSKIPMVSMMEGWRPPGLRPGALFLQNSLTFFTFIMWRFITLIVIPEVCSRLALVQSCCCWWQSTRSANYWY